MVEGGLVCLGWNRQIIVTITTGARRPSRSKSMIVSMMFVLVKWHPRSGGWMLDAWMLHVGSLVASCLLPQISPPNSHTNRPHIRCRSHDNSSLINKLCNCCNIISTSSMAPIQINTLSYHISAEMETFHWNPRRNPIQLQHFAATESCQILTSHMHHWCGFLFLQPKHETSDIHSIAKHTQLYASFGRHQSKPDKCSSTYKDWSWEWRESCKYSTNTLRPTLS